MLLQDPESGLGSNQQIDYTALTVAQVDSKIDIFLHIRPRESYRGYQLYCRSARTSTRNIIVLALSHTLLIVLWFGQQKIFTTESLSHDPDYSGQSTDSLTMTLNVLAVLTSIFAALLLVDRISHRSIASGRDPASARRRGYEALPSFLGRADAAVELFHALCLSSFMSIQAVLMAEQGSIPNAGLPVDTVFLAFLAPLAVNYTQGGHGRCSLHVLSWVIAFVVVVVSTVYYRLSALALLPMQYTLSAIMLYMLERNARVWYLARSMGRGVLKELLEYQQGSNLANQLNQDLRDIISNTAHDMKSPCTAMQLGLDDLRQLLFRPIPEQTDDKVFQDMLSETSQLIQNLRSTLAFMVMTNNRSMDFAKINRGLKLEPVHDAVDMKQILRWAINCVNWSDEGTIKVNPASTGLQLKGVTDSSWLKDNLLCVIANADKYTDPGTDVEVAVNKIGVGGREWVEVRVTYGGSSLEVKPGGTGTGSRAGNVGKDGVVDYKSFFELPTNGNRFEIGGHGLGLFCLERRVSVLQGACGAESRKGGLPGCTVWFRIPFHDSSRQAHTISGSRHNVMQPRPPTRSSRLKTRPKSGAAAAGTSGMSSGSGSSSRSGRLSSPTGSPLPRRRAPPRVPGPLPSQDQSQSQQQLLSSQSGRDRELHTVLVVDDSFSILKMTALVLERSQGCKVDKAKNGLLGLERMKAQLYDLVILDVQMPVMNGLEAARRLRAFEHESGRQRQLIVGVSANSEGVMKRICEEAGMDYFAIKPFALDDILAIYKRSQVPGVGSVQGLGSGQVSVPYSQSSAQIQN